MQAASWGTPDRILRGLEERRRVIGDFELNVAFRFGGTPFDVAERGLRLFAKEVLPVLKSWGPAGRAGRPAAPGYLTAGPVPPAPLTAAGAWPQDHRQDQDARMHGFALAYVALATKDVAAAAQVLGELLGLPRHDLDYAGSRAPTFALGETAVALFAPVDPFLGGSAKPGVHHLGVAAADPAQAGAALAQAGFRTAPAPGDAVALDPAETQGVRLRLSPPLGLGTGRSEHAVQIDHIGIASADNQAAIATFAGRLGLPVESQQTDMEVQIAVESFTSDRYGVVYHNRPPVPVGGLRVAFLTTGDCELEFLQNFDPRQAGQVAHGSAGNTRQDQGAIARFVASRGAGLHHLAFKAPDIDRTLAHLRRAGVPLIDHKGRPGSRRARIGFCHPDALGGVLIHAVERD